MLRIALGTLAARKAGILGALVGVTVAVSLVVSSSIVLESTLRGRPPVDRLRGAAIVVDRSQSRVLTREAADAVTLPEQARVDARVAARLRALPGVERAIADRTFPIELRGRRGGGQVPGHGWSSAALAGLVPAAGREPRGPSDIVLDAGLARSASVRVGDRIRIAAAGGRGVFSVVGIAAPRRGHAPSAGAAYFREDVGARLSATGSMVELIGVTVRPGTDVSALADRVRAVVAPSGLRVLTGASRGEAESLDVVLGRDGLLSGLGVLAGLGVFVVIFVVASAFALSVQQRHREIALLRAIGATPRQLRRMIAAEALVIAVVATAVAAPIGFLVALGERRASIATGVLPSDYRLVVSWIPIAIGLAAAVVTTQLASFVSGRRASRIRPLDALREAAVEPRLVSRFRAVAGLVALVIGVGIFVTAARNVSGGGGSDAPAAGVVWMAAATLLGPLLALPFVALIGAPLEAVGRGPAQLARASCRANLRRMTSIATPLMLTVSLACALVISKATVERATHAQAARSITADHVLVSSDGGLMPDVAAAARRIPGVRSVAATQATSVVVAPGGRNGNPTVVPARAVDGPTLAGAVDLDVAAGSLAALRGATFAADERLAQHLGWRIGDRITMWLGDGVPEHVRVVALFRRPLGFGRVVLPRAVVAGHVSDPLDDAVFVAGGSGTGLARQVGAHGRVEVLTRAQYLRRVDHEVRRQSIAVYVLLGVVVLFSAVAAVNALAVAVSERARDLELLRLIGATRRQLRRMVRLEVLIVVTFATVVGALTAAPGVVAFSVGETGSPVPAVPVWLWVGVPATATLLASAAIALPLRSAVRAGRGSITSGAS